MIVTVSLKPERSFRVNQVIPFLKTLEHTIAFPIQQVAIRGDPDYVLCVAGRFVSLELKAASGVTAPLQEFKRQQVNKTGGVGLIASPQNWEEIKKLLLQLDQGE